MGRNLFLEILKFMRFDDKPNRNKRGPDIDKFAPIREVFEKFTYCAKANMCLIFLSLSTNNLCLVSHGALLLDLCPTNPTNMG